MCQTLYIQCYLEKGPCRGNQVQVPGVRSSWMRMGPTSSVVFRREGKEEHPPREETQGKRPYKDGDRSEAPKGHAGTRPPALPRVCRRQSGLPSGTFRGNPRCLRLHFRLSSMDGEASRERLFPRVHIVSVPSWLKFTVIPNLIVTDIGFCLQKVYHFISTQQPRVSSSLPHCCSHTVQENCTSRNRRACQNSDREMALTHLLRMKE